MVKTFLTKFRCNTKTCKTTSKRSGRIYLFENHINLKRYEWIAFERYWWTRECTLYLRSKKCRHAVWPSSSSSHSLHRSPIPFLFCRGPPFRYRSLVLHLPKRSLCPLIFILLHLQNPLRISYPPPPSLLFFDRSSPIRNLANDASRFVDETTITRYSVSTIRKWIFRERNSIHRTLRAVQLIELTYPRI